MVRGAFLLVLAFTLRSLRAASLRPLRLKAVEFWQV